MNIILLSGGSGKRLWPLSNEIRSKQFIKIFKKSENGIFAGTEHSDGYESMLQRVYRQIKSIDKDAVVTIATSKSQVSAIHNQIGRDVGLSVEPCRRDTFPAIALAAAYLHDVKGVSLNEAVVICPVDPYVDDDYFQALKKLWELAQKDRANLILMGIDPTYSSEKYGYIMPTDRENVSRVSEFKEKPDAVTAQGYIDAGGLWNSGVFACKIGYVLERAGELLGFSGYGDLFAGYDTLETISFDYAVAEHEKDIAVLRFSGKWKDLGTWNTFTEAMEEPVIGDALLDESCENVHVINELDIPLLVIGGRDMVVSASPEGILVSDKAQSSYIKPFVDEIDRQIMFAEKSWGSYRVIDVGDESITVKVILNPLHKMNYHSHERRDEVWTVISGTGKTVVDGVEQYVKPGDVIKMAAGCRHTVIAGESGLQLTEVQLGKDISVNDKKKYDMPNNDSSSP